MGNTTNDAKAETQAPGRKARCAACCAARSIAWISRASSSTPAPLFDDFAREHLGHALVAKLDTDRNQATSRRYDVRGIPTLIVFRTGKEVAAKAEAS